MSNTVCVSKNMAIQVCLIGLLLVGLSGCAQQNKTVDLYVDAQALSNSGENEQAIEKLEQDGPFAVVVSDMQMPGISGVDLLRKAAVAAPDTVRILLTGYSDVDTATRGINEGRIFRYLTKPCSAEVMRAALNDGLRKVVLWTEKHDGREALFDDPGDPFFNVNTPEDLQQARAMRKDSA